MPAISTVRIPSACLQRVVTFSLLIPERKEAGPGPYSVLYLLHPHGGDHADWILKTRLEQYVKHLPLLVALPSLDNSLGCDMASGERYEQFFVEEFMAYVEATCLVKHGPENTAIAGAGTGGYAALRMAFNYPYWFGTAVSHSGTVCAPQEDRILKLPDGKERAARFRQAFGGPDDNRRKHLDLFRVVEGSAARKPPALMFDCGTEDDLLPHNRDLRKRLSALRIRHDYTEPRGGHDWSYWDQRLPVALNFIAKSLGIHSAGVTVQ